MNKVQIVEVGPRDGFQNLKDYIPVETKLKVIDDLIEAGVKSMQHTSFVSPKAIPQLRDAGEISKILLEKYPAYDFFALVPNLYGARKAYELGLRKVSYVVSLSASHNKANINRTHDESFAELKTIMDNYKDLDVCVDVATTFGCPFEGKYSTDTVLRFLDRIAKMGVKEMSLADTIGIANPKQVREIVTAAVKKFPEIEFQVHIHDTRNMGMVNTLTAIESGITKVQSTLGGLGGCPFAPGASGNTATEDLAYMLSDMGYETGIDVDKLIEAAKYEKSIISGNFSGHLVNIQKGTQCIN
ncbi:MULTISPECIES: hydroxymethylglutaryl-CoA lyase [unclassified Sedimentibacter]|uniref:hydroxymethylglutaryl-CoA lyase n=1 Tax=unclassified Sedimentibacter TaxID=2649220 RepID=UPI0027E0828B|nr:hydroxymethylglutaryl-CoA lyase [Sedimentibacter sp. MB35-C1]WMJ78839.1 hydroxymethylglutaryl-CoA lyase [Sedimentibacter sp. MB35-C1]